MTAYRYYSTLRPVSPGSYPRHGKEVLAIQNFDERIRIVGVNAWGYIDYADPLTEKETSDYELVLEKQEEAE